MSAQDRGHSRECQADIDRAEQARAEYAAQWPAYCRSCEGYGGRGYSYDPSPSGVALGPGSIDEFDPCDDCWAILKCPRCGIDGWPEDSDGDGPCSQCGWEGAEGMPQPPECWGDCTEVVRRG